MFLSGGRTLYKESFNDNDKLQIIGKTAFLQI